jgi:hypothetical protein
MGEEIQRWGKDNIDIDGYCLGLKQHGVDEDLRSPMTPTKNACSFDIFGDGTYEEDKDD